MFGYNQGYKFYLIILGVSLAVSLATQILLPYPYGLFVALGIFLSFPFIMRKMAVSKYGGLGGKFGGLENTKMIKTCMVCGSKAKGDHCNRCGSKSFKMS